LRQRSRTITEPDQIGQWFARFVRLARVKTQLDEAAFMAGWNGGQVLNAAQATAVALHEIEKGDV